MKLEHVLKRIGVTVVKTTASPGRLVLFLRVAEGHGSSWAETVEETLLAHADGGDKKWRLDVSKKYFPKDGVIRYLWRVDIASSDPEMLVEGTEQLCNAAVRAMSSTHVVTSMPLVGRKSYPYDPANGKIMGAHDVDTAGRVIAATGISQ